METWPGGYVRRDRKGRTVFVIRRMIHGRRYEVSTKRTTIRAALEELEKFERDPEGYAPASRSALVLDPQLAVQYLDHCVAEGNSDGWLRDKRRLITWWTDELSGRDLRRVTVETIERSLAAAGNDRAHRIIVLKDLYAWLVEKGRIRPTEDPTFRRLKVPSARPEQWERSKAMDRVEHRVWLAVLQGPWRDAIIVLANTGWHVTELERFAAGGLVEKHPDGDAVLVCPRRKSGEPQRSRVPRDVAEAAARLVARGACSGHSLRKEVKYQLERHARRGVGLPPLPIGSYRHSVATWAINAGADVVAVSQFLGHKSPRTMKKFYATHATVARPKGLDDAAEGPTEKHPRESET